jgi:lipid-binding SYLF domain-containing protein
MTGVGAQRVAFPPPADDPRPKRMRMRKLDRRGKVILSIAAAAAVIVNAGAAWAYWKLGGAGTGVAVDQRTGKHTYMRMATGGVGLGLGAQTFDLVILFEGQGQIERFVQGGWDATTGAAAAAGQSGVSAASSFVDGIAVFQLTDKGLLAQADVSGARFWRVDELN